ncbi:hypothetical protein [Mycoplasma sp. 46852]|uniref:hypothetical protein n=1 Tax=Mycoplasma sp. 46852 TaxID=3401683 RepID=UPI003AAB7785
MKKIKTILCLTTISAFATLPMVSSSCTHQEEPELNGQKLYKNAQLAANYNALKKSNVATINQINSLFFKIDPKFNKKISINASAFIDWANVEAILKYNEKYSDKQWYKMLVGNLYDALTEQDNTQEFNKSAVVVDFYEELVDDIYKVVFVNKNNNLANLYTLNNYIKYILDIIQSYEHKNLNQSVYWINNIQDLFKKLVVPSAYIVDPDIVEDNSKFATLANNNLWDVLKNMKQYSNGAISILDFPNGDLTETKNEIEALIKKQNDEFSKLFPSWIHNSDDDAKISPLITDKVYGRYGRLEQYANISNIISSWEHALKAIKDNEDYSLISLKEAKSKKENDNFSLHISLGFSYKFSQKYTIENKKTRANALSVGINLNNAIPLTYSMFKNEYEPLISSAIAYILSINNANSKIQEEDSKDIKLIELKYKLIEQDKYSYNFFKELETYIRNIKDNQTSLELSLPVGEIRDSLMDNIKYSEIWTEISITDHELPIFYILQAAEINSK